MFVPGGWELLVILGIVLLLFGNRLPSVMRSLGQSITEFKKGARDAVEEPEKKFEDHEAKV